jgi:hypothetical protein
VSTADELRKLHELLLAGALTQQEFDGQKGVLLRTEVQEGDAKGTNLPNSWTVTLFAPEGEERVEQVSGSYEEAELVARAAVEKAGGQDAERSEYGWRSPDGAFAATIQRDETTDVPPVSAPPVVGSVSAGDSSLDADGIPVTTAGDQPNFVLSITHRPLSQTRKRQIMVGSAVIVVAVVLLIILLTNHQSGGVSTIPGSGGLTPAALQTSAQNQIFDPAPSGFGVKEVASTICNPPSTWVPGKTFTCFAYSSNGTGLGKYLGTVEPNNSNGNVQWNAQWVPAG